MPASVCLFESGLSPGETMTRGQVQKLELKLLVFYFASIALLLDWSCASANDLVNGELLNRPAREVGDFGPIRTSSPPLPKIVPDFSAIKKRMFEAEKAFDKQKQSNLAHESLELSASWIEWNKRIDDAISKKLLQLLNPSSFPAARKLTGTVTYTVTSDGRIINARLTTKSSNPIMNAAILMAINSLDGNLALLQFPSGTSKEEVNKLFDSESASVEEESEPNDSLTAPGK